MHVEYLSQIIFVQLPSSNFCLATWKQNGNVVTTPVRSQGVPGILGTKKTKKRTRSVVSAVVARNVAFKEKPLEKAAFARLPIQNRGKPNRHSALTSHGEVEVRY